MSTAGTEGEEFELLQKEHLEAAWRADLTGSTTPHVMIGLPSYSVDRSLYEHYGDRVPALENRYLYGILRSRDRYTRVVYPSSLPVRPDVLDGYLALLDGTSPDTVLARSMLVSPDDTTPRSLAEKLLDRGDLIDAIRAFIGDEPAVIEPWNVTDCEAALAVALRAPIHGTNPRLRTIATKSNGRRLLRDAGVPVPDGVEDVRSAADVERAVTTLQRRNPDLRSVVVKLDDSVAGDGNIVLSLDPPPDAAGVDAALPDWYRGLLRNGGIVEERIEGEDFRSPSAQGTIAPTGAVVVLATHEQRLGGDNGQVYEGCSFPADAEYAPLLARYAEATGHGLAALGACGRFAVDFVVCRRAGRWDVYALEINLRKGGTTHPYGITRLVVGGGYDAPSATYHDGRGRPVHYGATDNLVDPAWLGRSPVDVRRMLAEAGALYDHATGEGVIPHLLDCLAVDGRMGYTAIARTPAAVGELEARVVAALAP